VVNVVIVCNFDWCFKWLWMVVEGGVKIVGYVVDNEYDEVVFVVEEIDCFGDIDGVWLGDVVVFYCMNV